MMVSVHDVVNPSQFALLKFHLELLLRSIRTGKDNALNTGWWLLPQVLGSTDQLHFAASSAVVIVRSITDASPVPAL